MPVFVKIWTIVAPVYDEIFVGESGAGVVCAGVRDSPVLFEGGKGGSVEL